MNPENRILIQVTMEDAIKADEIFATLMGDEVEPRREFIIKNSKFVKIWIYNLFIKGLISCNWGQVYFASLF